MSAVTCACPSCHAPLQPPDALPATVACRCGARCTLTAAGTVILLPPSAQLPPAAQGQPAKGILVSSRPKSRTAPVPAPVTAAPAASAPPPASPRERSGSPVWLYAGLALLSVVVIGGAVWAIIAHQRGSSRPDALAVNPAEAPAPAAPGGGAAPPATSPDGHEPAEAPGQPPAPAPPAPAGERPAGSKDPLAGYVPPSAAGGTKSVALPPSLKLPGEADWESSLSAAEQERVNKAIDRGVAYLKARISGGDRLAGRAGVQALLGLTLLACGVPADDPAVRLLVGRVRSAADAEHQTYDLALSILFLDRLGEADDRDVIRTLALRLVAGQNASGGWSYQCPLLPGSERDDLLDLLEAMSPPTHGAVVSDPDGRTMTGKSEPGRVAPPGPAPSSNRLIDPVAPRRPRADLGNRQVNKDGLSVPLKNLPAVRFRPGDKPNFQDMSDNSNTQFAVLALWVARKYGVPVDRTMALVDARFRASQNRDGSWCYHPLTEQWPDSMTCSGLLGLAVGRGIVRGDAKASARDPDIAHGLRYLGDHIGEPGRKGRPRSPRGTGQIIGANAHGDLYFLWSVERVAVVYDLRTIAGKDWYAWGAPILVDHQADDGSWHDTFEPAVDTCFALLFLKRVNVAQDLTATLRSFDNLVDQADGGKVGRVPSK